MRRRSATRPQEVAQGEHDDQFPIDVFQTGSGTSTNMNVNEVLARLAHLATGEAVHPNDHVNAGQSSNDTFPSALRIAATLAVHRELAPALVHLAQALRAKESEFADVVKAGRTHLMDAVPVTLGQEFGGYARQVELGAERVLVAAQATAELPLGGTAAGTGLNAAPGFAAAVIERVSERTGVAFREAANHFEAQSAQDAVVELSGALRVVAVSLTKICNDLRWMSSGPRSGLGEIHLPDLQPGSSIMPGKVNPVIAEATLMACAQVIGNDTTITLAGASGAFELNVMLPVMARNILESAELLAATSRLLADRCVDGIEADRERALELAAGFALDRHTAEPLHRLRGRRGRGEAVHQGAPPDPGHRRRAGTCGQWRDHGAAARRRSRRPGDDPATGLSSWARFGFAQHRSGLLSTSAVSGLPRCSRRCRGCRRRT